MHGMKVFCANNKSAGLRPALFFHEQPYILLFGAERPLKIVQNPECFFDGQAVYMHPDISGRDIVFQLKQALYPYVFEDVKNICNASGIKLNSISVNSARTRWGSCNTQARRLNFSYRLVFTDRELIFAVAAHECAHLLVPNHSSRFYEALSVLDPEWRLHRQMLRRFENEYNIYNLFN